MEPFRRPARAAVAVLVGALVATGSAACSRGPAPDGEAASATSGEPLLEALVWRSREDEAAGRRLQVKVTNAGADTVRVVAVRLLGGGLAELAATPKDVEFAPGRRFDLQVPVGAATCDGPPGAPVAEVTWRRSGATGGADGAGGVSLVVPQVQDDVVRRMHDQECAAAEIARTVTLTLVVDAAAAAAQAVGSGPGARVPAVLRLRRGGGPEAATVETVAGSILYAVVPASPPDPAGRDAPSPAGPLATLASGETTLDVPLRVGAETCDGHRIGEAKKPFVVPASVRVGTASPVTVDVDVPPPTRSVLQSLLSRVCAR